MAHWIRNRASIPDPNAAPSLWVVWFGGTESRWVNKGMLTEKGNKFTAWFPEGSPLGFVTYITSKRMVLAAIYIQYHQEKPCQVSVRHFAAALNLTDARVEACFYRIHPLQGFSPSTPFGMLSPSNVRAGFLQVPSNWEELFPPTRTVPDGLELNMEA